MARNFPLGLKPIGHLGDREERDVWRWAIRPPPQVVHGIARRRRHFLDIAGPGFSLALAAPVTLSDGGNDLPSTVSTTMPTVAIAAFEYFVLVPGS